MNKVVKIGAGAGFAQDRVLPAKDLAERGDIDYLIFECLAERTIAAAERVKLEHPELGYNEYLEERFEAVLPACAKRGIKIITNMGAANPEAAGKKVAEIAKKLNISGLKIAVVTGDDVIAHIHDQDWKLLERDAPVSTVTDRIVSANAYLGSEALVEALRAGADIVITGRVADPSLFIAPLIYEYNWAPDNWNLVAKGIHMGHLLECTAHVTGGYFVDPGFKDVPDPAHIGFPIAEVEPDGTFVVTKIPGTGGRVSRETCIEQTLYEIHDPENYPTADCVADFSQAQFEEIAPDRIRVTGARGKAKTDSYKVSVGYIDSYIGEGQFSYCGLNAVSRGRLALEMIRQRIIDQGIYTTEEQFEIIGVDSALRGEALAQVPEPTDIRIRVAVRTNNLKDAEKVGHEVLALWLNGPAGGGGGWKRAEEIVAILSILLPRDLVQTSVSYVEV